MNAVGQPISRVDGRLKVTGDARYTADIRLEALVHAAIVYSTIANGRTVSIDTTAAENAPGVLAVLTHKNMPRMKALPWSHLRPHRLITGPHRAMRQGSAKRRPLNSSFLCKPSDTPHFVPCRRFELSFAQQCKRCTGRRMPGGSPLQD